MTHPSDDDIAGLLVDAPDLDAGVSAHVATCQRCTQVMVELADVELGIARASAVHLPSPPPQVWDRIAAATRSGYADPADPAQHTDPAAEVTSTSVSITPIRSEHRSQRRWQPRQWLTAAAAAALLFAAGIGLGRLTASRTDLLPVAATALRSLDGTQVMGSADVVRVDGGERLRVHPTTPVAAPRNGYIEIWLLNQDGARMVSVGVLDTGRDADLPVPPGALGEGYRVVDLSYELFDDKPAHSGDSIMRGTLTG